MKMGKYVYCITRSAIIKNNGEAKLEAEGIDSATIIEAIPYKNLACWASDAEMKDYKPSDENVKTHEAIVRHVMENETVLPVAYGMVFKSKKILLGVMRRVYGLLKRSMKEIDGKVELGVKAILDKEANFEKERREECVRQIFETLKDKAASAKKGKLFSDRLLLNASFLIDKDKIDNFSKEVGKLKKKNNNLKIQYTGPWPPYNFVDVRIMSRGGRR